MKKILAGLVFIAVLALAGCGANDTFEYKAKPVKLKDQIALDKEKRPTTPEATHPDSKCFNLTWVWTDQGFWGGPDHTYPVGKYCRVK